MVLARRIVGRAAVLLLLTEHLLSNIELIGEKSGFRS